MYCPYPYSTHIIRQGDSLYRLARSYQTTPQMILSLNPYIDPYNLQIGTPIIICPSTSLIAQTRQQAPILQGGRSSLVNSMRLVGEQQIYWTRMLIMGIVDGPNAEVEAITNRLMQNINDITDIFERYYTTETAEEIRHLLTRHMQIISELITALFNGKVAESENLYRQWIINANAIIDIFSNINPYYNHEDLHNMFITYMELTKQEITANLSKNYAMDIAYFDKIEQLALTMADYFALGIAASFPQDFS